jgi:hypothetical protein
MPRIFDNINHHLFLDLKQAFKLPIALIFASDTSILAVGKSWTRLSNPGWVVKVTVCDC